MATPTPEEIEYMLSHIDDDISVNYIVGNAVCIGFAIVAVIFRFISRTMGGIRLGFDDWTILAALIITMVFTAAMLVTVHYGMGRHVVPHVTEVKPFVQWAIAGESLYSASICMIKISVLALYRRIFPLRWFTVSIWSIGTVIVLYTIPQILTVALQCVPLSAKWTPGIEAKCINFTAQLITYGVINVVSDFVLLGLPIPALWSLQVSSSRRWALIFMFAIGGVTCIISIVRLFFARQVETHDPSWDLVWPSFISGLECCAAIVAACAPTYRPIMNKIRNKQPTGNTSVRTTRPTENTSRRLESIGIPLWRLWPSNHSNLATKSTNSSDVRLYNQLGRGSDFEARGEAHIEAGVGDSWETRPRAKKQEILVTNSITTHSG